MSQTTAMDAVGPGRWTHMASVMTEVLESTLARGTTNLDEIPVAVLAAARQFFELVGDALEGQVPENPQASVANYRIAANAIRASASPPPASRNDLEARIRSFAGFLSTLENKKLSEKDLVTAKALRDFFRELAAEGAAEQYEQFASMPVRGLPTT